MTSFFGTCLGKPFPDLLLLLVLEVMTDGADGRWMSGGTKWEF
jgi:hypothetical protein